MYGERHLFQHALQEEDGVGGGAARTEAGHLEARAAVRLGRLLPAGPLDIGSNGSCRSMAVYGWSLGLILQTSTCTREGPAVALDVFPPWRSSLQVALAVPDQDLAGERELRVSRPATPSA
jgi:hypothetical protein